MMRGSASCLGGRCRLAAAPRRIKFDPCWCMIARLFPPAWARIDPRSSEPLRRSLVEKQMIDADPGIAFERLAPIGPEAVNALVRVKVANGVGPALAEQPLVRVARFGREK